MNKLIIVGIIVIVAVAFTGLTFAGYVPVLSDALQPDNTNNNETPLDSEEPLSMKVGSSGMEPAIMAGATITYEETPYETLEVGDIIVYKISETSQYFIGRIAEITDEGIKTKGDKSVAQDQWTLTESLVVGKVIDIDNP